MGRCLRGDLRDDGGAEHAATNGNAEAPERFEVGAADKAETDDGDGMFHGASSPTRNFRAKRTRILR